MPAPDSVLKLCENFALHREHYRSSSYNETELRREFLDPFFKALGWDIDNEQGYADAYKDVIHEDAIKIGGITKAPDYCFRIGGTRKFFLEAKKPSVNIRDDISPAYQLRRYAWSGKLPLSILSDFEELAIYDCRSRPFPTDKPSKARTFYCTFEQYGEKWDEIAAVFSRDAILRGSFDKYAETSRGKRGTEEVDDAFLSEIERWRELVAKNLAIRNKSLSERDLNFAVQKIIDRIIFLRICEDRGSEDYERLRKRLTGKDLYRILLEEFKRADARYNSGLFHFTNEKDRPEAPDTLTTSLSLDDKVLKDIIKNLYYPDSPYEFSVFSADILGQVYEQFLGKTIQLTAGHLAKIEEKPELRKVGGVYYTPKYIVDYIVENTLGRILNGGKVPLSIAKAAEVRVLDPTCGSGSFLIVAYQYLLDWHRDQYTLDPKTLLPDEKKAVANSKGRSPVIYQAQGGEWKLTIAERKRILLNNIYGVDIDSQAVEVTKLSLLLKVLEGETATTTQRDFLKERQRILPDLGDNIKCGNSLIGPDFYDQPDLPEFDEEAKYRINVFDWRSAFPHVFRQGGFDCVIGNPPYRRELDFKELMDEIAQSALGKQYRSPRMDLWYYFVHQGSKLLKPTGSLSFIVNSYWTASTGAAKLIEQMKFNMTVEEIFHLGKLKIFKNVSGQHMVIRLKNRVIDELETKILMADESKGVTAAENISGRVRPDSFYRKRHDLFKGSIVNIARSTDSIQEKISSFPKLETMGIVRQGIAENPSAINKKTNLKFGSRWNVGQGVFALKQNELEEIGISDAEMSLVRPYHDLCDLGRYRRSKKPSLYLIYSTKDTCPDIRKYPAIEKHLKRFKDVMDLRRETLNNSNKWWHLHWPRDPSIWNARKVLSIQMAARPSFVTALAPTYVPFSVNVFVPANDTPISPHYFTGLLNSKLLWAWFDVNAKRRGVGLEINGGVLSMAPIRPIDFTDPADVAQHDMMVTLVESMLNLHEKHAMEKNPNTLRMLATDISSTERRIDRIVCELYGLTEAEAAIVDKRI